MARRFIDISVTLENGIKSDPDFMIPKITYDTHDKNHRRHLRLLPRPDEG